MKKKYGTVVDKYIKISFKHIYVYRINMIITEKILKVFSV